MTGMQAAITQVRAVFRKEILDHSRDHRSLVGILALPVAGPALVFILVSFLADTFKDKPLEVPIVGADNAPALVEFLKDQGVEVQPPPEEPEARVLAGDAEVILRIGDKFRENFAAGRQARVGLLVDDSNNQARSTARRVEGLVHQYSQSVGAQRLIVRGIVPEVSQPLAIAHINLASREKLAAQLLNVIPLMLMFAGLMGGMNIAIDATAGERERGSLEPLLLNPVPRLNLVLGKWLATVVSATGVVLLAIAGFVGILRVAPLEDIGMKVNFGPLEAITALGLVMPLVLLGSALQLIVAIFARSFKEAQTYLSLVNMLPMIPSVVLMLNPGKVQEWMLLVPGLAQVVAVGDLLRGELPSALRWALCWGSSLGLTIAMLAVVVRLLGRERIVFGR